MQARSITTIGAASLIALGSLALAQPVHAAQIITVTIDQAAGQADPSTDCTINFTAVFDTDVTGFTGSDVTLGGTAGATTAVVSGGPSTYTVAVSGMTGAGTVTVAVPAGVAGDGTDTNSASTSSDNTVTWSAPDPNTCAATSTAQGTTDTIPAWVQAYGRASADATCLEGWSPSWEAWAEDVTGGWVCTRSIPSFG